jgi:GDP-L-fucose synthase
VSLLDRSEVDAFITAQKPDYILLASVRSGGIGANQQFPAEFIYENLVAQSNVIDAACRAGVRKLLYLAASCVYPKDCQQPMKEDYFQTGRMEPTSVPYSMAKTAGIIMCQAYRRQYGFSAIIGVPATVYGPGGDESPKEAHVLGSMMDKFRVAMQAHDAEITFWGTGAPRREFIYSKDLAEACALLLDVYDQPEMINIGPGRDISIMELAALVKDVYHFTGDICWDTSKPDGALKKLLDSSRLLALGWRPSTALRDGISACAFPAR